MRRTFPVKNGSRDTTSVTDRSYILLRASVDERMKAVLPRLTGVVFPGNGQVIDKHGDTLSDASCIATYALVCNVTGDEYSSSSKELR